MEPRHILGIILLLIQASIIVPLILELRTTRSSSGISILSETAWIIAGAGWSLYGYLTGSSTLIISGALATVGSALVYYLVYTDVDNPTKQRSLILSIVFTIIMLLSTMIFHAAGLAIFLSIFGLIQFIPQMITSLKSIKHEDGHGIPLIGTGLRSLYTLSWAIYAGAWFIWGMSLNEIDYPLAVWGATGFVAFSLQFIAGFIVQNNKTKLVNNS